MIETIKKTQKVILFPEDMEINKEANQEVRISEEGKFISIMHDGDALFMSIENFIKFRELMDSALSELITLNIKLQITG